MSGRILRPAQARECGALTALALRSKAYWGYDAGFIHACRDELAVSRADVAAGRVTVLAEGQTVLGFYTLNPEERADEASLTFLYVEPGAIGHGLGRALWQHMVAKASAQGIQRLKIESDPFALGFFRAMGAALSGKVRSPVNAPDGSERFLPLLYYDL